MEKSKFANIPSPFLDGDDAGAGAGAGAGESKTRSLSIPALLSSPPVGVEKDTKRGDGALEGDSTPNDSNLC